MLFLLKRLLQCIRLHIMHLFECLKLILHLFQEKGDTISPPKVQKHSEVYMLHLRARAYERLILSVALFTHAIQFISSLAQCS